MSTETEHNPITSDYASHTKDELFAELERRDKSSIVTSSANKADLVAALELLDEQDKQDKAGEENLPEVPQVVIPDVVERSDPPRNTDYTKGIFVKRRGDFAGEEFALAIHEPDTYERTHSLKNRLHFWEGNAEQFAAEFEKK